MSLSISNANPIQFWLTGEESYNQKEECSIYPVCFCQTIQSSDNLVFSLIDSADAANFLVIYLDDGTVFRVFDYGVSGLGDHYQYSLIGGIALWTTVLNRKLIFKIYSNAYTLIAPSSWSNLTAGGADPYGSKTATQLIKNAMTLAHIYGAYQPAVLLTGQTPSPIVLHIKITGLSTSSVQVGVGFRPSDSGSTSSFTIQSFSSNVDADYIFTFPALTSDSTIFSISVANASLNNANVEITVPVGQFLNADGLRAFSDCVEVTDNEDFICTKLITYTNSSYFAGLGFPAAFSSPSSTSLIYYLRVPAIFFDEQFPQEQEDLELSTDEIITLWSKIEGKKLLDIGFMPFYMHLKLQMILMMDSVSIDGVSWRLRDPYQITAPGSKRSALRKAQVLLSDKDFIDRNLL